MPASLKNCRVLVTRPAHQAETFCLSIVQAGGSAVRFPTLEICPAKNSAFLSNLPDKLEDFDYAIFISANAVEQTFNRLVGNKFPGSVSCVAVGNKTALALRHHGQPVAIAPKTGYTSEALLARPEMQLMQNKKVIIFRGEGGRELLAQTLQKRGAIVKYAEVYRRCLPEYTNDQIRKVMEKDAVNVITITSTESLNNLASLFARIDGNYLRGLPIILGSGRILDSAQQLDFNQPPIVAHDPSDEAMFEALLSWAKTVGVKNTIKPKKLS